MISSLRAFLSTFAQQVPASCLTIDDQLIFASVAQAQFFRQWLLSQHQDQSIPLPEFMSLQTWLKQQYLLQPHTQCTICEHLQQLQIWYNAVIQTPYFVDQPTLAWQTARQYQAQYRHEASFFLEETSHDSAYQAARAFYLQCLENNQLTDYTQLAKTFSAWHEIASPHRFFWIGFSVCTPSLRAIITHLPKQKICYLAPTSQQNETIVKTLPSTHQQIDYLVADYLSDQTKPQASTVAVVLLDTKCYTEIITPAVNILAQRCAGISRQGAAKSSPFSSLLSTPLAIQPLAQAIHMLLDFFIHRNQANILLFYKHPIWHKKHISKSSYHFVITHLHQLGMTKWPQSFTWPKTAPPDCDEVYTDFYALLTYDCPEQATYPQWQSWAQQLFSCMLAYYVPLDQEESQLFLQIYEAIAQSPIFPEFTSHQISYPQFLAYIDAHLHHTDVKKPEKLQSWIVTSWNHILDMPFDKTIFLSAHAGTWPGHIACHDNNEHLLFWQQIQSERAYHCKMAVFLQPSIDAQQQQLLPSPLLADLACTPAQIPLPQHRVFHLEKQTVAQKLYFKGPELSYAEQTLSTSALQRVSRCLAQGFYQNRLHINADQSRTYGISALDIGNLTHAVLQQCDHIIDNKPSSQTDLKTLILDIMAIHSPFKRLYTQQKNSLCTHVSKTVRQWLDYRHEVHQTDDAICSKHEVSQTQSLFGLSVRMRFDRIDYFSDGSCRIIDYKTGLTNRADWLSGKSQHPQMILYALGQPHTTSIAYACLHPEQFGYQGYTALDNDLLGIKPIQSITLSTSPCGKKVMNSWPTQMSLWRSQMRDLIQRYQSGYYFINPSTGTTTCQRCQLQSVCRYYEHDASLFSTQHSTDN